MSLVMLEERYLELKERIAIAAESVGRAPSEIMLLAVSKGQNAESIRTVAELGLKNFGENYFQELSSKSAELSDTEINWNFQGTLQRRKIKDILKITSSILSVARIEELEEIEKRANLLLHSNDSRRLQPAQCNCSCYIEVNIGREPRKNGVLPENLRALLDFAETLSKVKIDGLMTVPPAGSNPSRWFAELRELGMRNGISKFSMGMSSDFESAIREGSTMVRIGTALFGERPSKI